MPRQLASGQCKDLSFSAFRQSVNFGDIEFIFVMHAHLIEVFMVSI
jgi:hypothetical protein